MSWKTWKKIFVMKCHGNVMEFCFSGKVMEMSWNFIKISWKKYVFTNSVIRKKIVYFLKNYIKKSLRLRRNCIFLSHLNISILN